MTSLRAFEPWFRIDAYAHVLPREFIDLMREVHPTDELTTADVPHLYRRSRPSASGLDPEAVHGDTAREGSSELLEDGLEFYGEDGLVFGTDYPFGPEKGRVFMRNEVTAVEGMDVPDDTKAAVFGENIDAIL